MKGLLIVNSFLNTTKFNNLYDFFLESSKKYNIELKIKKSDFFSICLNVDLNKIIDADFILFWDKDIYLAQRLEKAGFKVFNNAKGIEICDNKALTNLYLKDCVKIPKTIIAPKTFEGVNYNDLTFLEKACNELKFPVIIKEVYGSFGKQVYLANCLDEAKKIISEIGHKDFIIQEFINTSNGKDIRVNVVGGKVVASMYRYNENDFRSNISNGGKMKCIKLSKAQEEAAIKACQALRLDFAGVDVLFGENDEPIICEVNSNPHFKSTLECTGINIADCILEYILEVLK